MYTKQSQTSIHVTLKPVLRSFQKQIDSLDSRDQQMRKDGAKTSTLSVFMVFLNERRPYFVI